MLLAFLGALAAVLHTGNLVHLARGLGCEPFDFACPALKSALAPPDTNSYLRVAEQIREKGFFAASYFRRLPGLPLGLLAADTLAGEPTAFAWLSPLLAAGAAAAIGWIAATLSGSIGAGLAAGLLFCLWPNAYQYGPLLITDAAHAFLAVAALAATLWWRDSERPRAAGLAGGLWLAAQTLRPTFLALPALLPLLVWKRAGARRYLKCSLALWIATCAVPAFVLTSNLVREGRLLPIRGCYAVPRLKHELGLGNFDALRKECLKAFRTDTDRALEASREREFLLAHPQEALRSFLDEISHQTLFGLRPYYYRRLAPLYPGWMSVGTRFVGLFWLCSAVGLVMVARRDPPLALFWLLCFGLVMIPAANTTRVGGRIRFPLDLIYIPVAVLFVAKLVSRPRDPPAERPDQAGSTTP